MFLYASSLDAYLCYNPSTREFSFETFDDIHRSLAEHETYEWEHWDMIHRDEKNYIVYHLPGGQTVYLCCIFSIKDVPNFCFRLCFTTKPTIVEFEIQHDWLVIKHLGDVYYFVPNRSTPHFQMKKELNTEEAEHARMEMICMLPHHLK